MAENTKIEWASHTFNPWRGCAKVSAGCVNCYAETMSKRNLKVLGLWGPNGTRVVASESMWREPVKWNKSAACQCGGGFRVTHSPYCPQANRPRVFCASFADIFEEWTKPMVDASGEELGNYENDGPLTMQDVRERLFALIDATPNLDWLLLTKRPENVLKMAYDAWCKKVPGHVSQNEGDGRHWAFPPNVWIGVSVENQQAADERIPRLLRVPAAVRFLSCEPLLKPVELKQWLVQGWCPSCNSTCFRFGGSCRGCGGPATPLLHWVIVGGESGKGARPCRVEWIRDIVRQCKDTGVPCFVKQLGQRPTSTLPDNETWPGGNGLPSCGHLEFIGDGFGNYHVSGLLDRKGGDWSEWPADLRVREFPT